MNTLSIFWPIHYNQPLLYTLKELQQTIELKINVDI